MDPYDVMVFEELAVSSNLIQLSPTPPAPSPPLLTSLLHSLTLCSLCPTSLTHPHPLTSLLTPYPPPSLFQLKLKYCKKITNATIIGTEPLRLYPNIQWQVPQLIQLSSWCQWDGLTALAVRTSNKLLKCQALIIPGGELTSDPNFTSITQISKPGKNGEKRFHFLQEVQSPV